MGQTHEWPRGGGASKHRWLQPPLSTLQADSAATINKKAFGLCHWCILKLGNGSPVTCNGFDRRQNFNGTGNCTGIGTILMPNYRKQGQFQLSCEKFRSWCGSISVWISHNIFAYKSARLCRKLLKPVLRDTLWDRKSRSMKLVKRPFVRDSLDFNQVRNFVTICSPPKNLPNFIISTFSKLHEPNIAITNVAHDERHSSATQSPVGVTHLAAVACGTRGCPSGPRGPCVACPGCLRPACWQSWWPCPASRSSTPGHHAGRGRMGVAGPFLLTSAEK